MKKLLVLLLVCGLTACAAPQKTVQSQKGPELLTVHNDGRMEYRDRTMPEDDVIIYPDGFGGERAAVKMLIPLTDNYYFRDSIRVERLDNQEEITLN